jgi:heme/copper-type cytochrome/quinol oxidase subunit 2
MIAALFMLMAGLLLLFGSIFWVWMLVDCATKESDQGNTKIIWLLIIIFTHLIGALIYFFVRRPERIYAGAPFSRS